MKWIKIYLVVVTLLLLGAIGAGVYVWYQVQELSSSIGTESTTSAKSGDTTRNETGVSETSASDSKKAEKAPNTNTESDVPTSNAVSEVKAPIVVETTKLSETQQTLLKSIGITESTITITPEMITCAENAVGAQRLSEITAGASPSAFESVKLLPCFKK